MGAVAGRSFSDRLLDFLDVIEARQLTEPDDLEAVFRLRYNAYLREGAISGDPSKRFTDSYDLSPNAHIFGIYIEGVLASSLRVHLASPAYPDVPGMGVFSDILVPELERGRTIIDPTRFVADHRLARLHPELPYATVRLGFVATEYYKADLALATVRAEHQAFYRRIFSFKPLCPPREYPSLTKPISLMAIEYREFRESVVNRYPFLLSTPEERAQLFGKPDGSIPEPSFDPPPKRDAPRNANHRAA
ncbi:N-acyl amino acid synthase FeeM domain-containing protein [Terrihabitans sp. B22-R8]|uniref:N-acyl amino acid synthase FeeM domain-containing protein n=1 Tax=Terrihabitans sp. B22-R8 TaxID=3425128 RepID=UPI00403CD577